MNEHQSRRFAERAAATAREGTSAAEETTQAVSQGYFAAAEAARDFNMKLVEIAQANAMATLNLAQAVATAKPTEAAAVWSSHARKNFDTLTEQSKQLTALAQRVITCAAEPFAHSLAQTVQRRS
jgi:hypothetical protein